VPNNFKKVDWVVAESLRLLLNKLEVGQFFNTDLSKEYKKAFAVGSTIRVKFPQRFITRDGVGYSPQPIDRKTTDVIVDQLVGVDFEWDSVEKVLDMERGEEAVKREYLDPAMAAISQEIDSRCAKYAYQNCPNISGVLGTTPTAITTYLGAEQLLFEQSCPSNDRGLIISAGMDATIVGQLTLLTNPQAEISHQYRNGFMRRAAGFDWYRSNSLWDHTCGTWASACTVQTTPSDGATSLTVGGTVTQTFKKGDVVNLTATYATNPSTHRSTGVLKTFVVTQDLTLTGGTSDTLYLYPPLYGPGSPYQNVDAMPVGATAVVTNWPGTTTPGTGPKHGVQGLALQRDAFALAGVSLELPKSSSVEIARQMRDPETGIAISFIRSFEPRTLSWINRFDCLFGFGVLHAQHCSVRIPSLI
jgi:hypothetical protein